MALMGLFLYVSALCLILLLVIAGCQDIGKLHRGFTAEWFDWYNDNWLFVLSNSYVFGFGYYHVENRVHYSLAVIHVDSGKPVWTAKDLTGDTKHLFAFEENGDIFLKSGNDVTWSPDTSGQKVASMELQDSGNLVLLGEGGVVLWQSFSHPTDTLLVGQEFLEGMKLKSYPNSNNLSVYLEFKSGDLVLDAGYQTPQTYWSLANDSRKSNSSVSGKVHFASLLANAWNFYDQNKTLLWQFHFSKTTDQNASWALILGSDGQITFSNLHKGYEVTPEALMIPEKSCSTPEPCGQFSVCHSRNLCQCPTTLNSQFNCRPPIALTCNSSKDSAKLLYVGDDLDYFALRFVKPFSGYNLDACKEACLHNCSCSALFFRNNSQSCFLFDQIGSLQSSQNGSPGYVSYVKISNDRGRNRGKKKILIVVSEIVASILFIGTLLCVAVWHCCKKKILMKFSPGKLEEDENLDSLSGNPVRFAYNDLCQATKKFSTIIGQGGFGSVYLGLLPDGTRLAVKKLSSIGQGKKEFRAEVSTIGKVHHLNLVKLRGFCAEGTHRLLVYEYMGNGSLNKWIFKTDEESQLLSWNIRFNIALGTAKGLAYLHSECEEKIVHCDIKPENVLLDENFTAKVSDFGLAKLMKHEESVAYTTLRGTRGYLAPEWIRNNPISEKSDVYSYGMVLLEIIGGRRSYDPDYDSEKAHLPSYAFKMLEEGKLRDVIDPKLDIDENDERVVNAILIALWCIQEEMHLRPPMTKVVQMLEGSCDVPLPPNPSQLSSKAYPSFIKWSNEEDSSSTLFDSSNGGLLSMVQLSGPR